MAKRVEKKTSTARRATKTLRPRKRPPLASASARATSTPELRRDKPASLRIVMISSEATPFSQTGGLADGATSLTRALGRLGHHVTLVTPRYRGVPEGERGHAIRAYVADHWFDATFSAVPLGPGATALLVDCPPLYDRPGLYAEHNTDYADNAVRFAFLSIAALEWAAEQPEAPSIIHAHDWQAGLTPVYGRRFGASTIFTIHNIAFQGVFDKSWVPRLGLSWDDFTLSGFEYYDHVSFMKSGLNFSSAITAVSPTYADEIQRPEYGHGLHGLIAARRDVLTGILNGIDVDAWNPRNDPHLPAPFDSNDLAGKRAAKQALLQLFALPSDAAAMGRPVIGMVSRMTEQKGLDLIEAIAPQLPSLDATFIIVGTGAPRYERMWRELAAAAPERIGVFIGFDERRAHLIEGGSDMFLLPSQVEPCGLNQMYSMRYGTVPIVHAVGGLVDTVRPYNARSGQGTGFLFSGYDPAALLDGIRRALDTYRQPQAWRRLQTNGMAQDFSWERSAAEYVKVYKRVMGGGKKSRRAITARA